MPKVTKTEVADALTEELEMGSDEGLKVYDMVLDANRPVYTFGRELKYVYPDDVNTPELRQKYRRQERKAKERQAKLDRGETVRTRGPKKTDYEKRYARSVRRQIRTAVKDKAILMLAEQRGVSYEDMVADLRDSVINS